MRPLKAVVDLDAVQYNVEMIKRKIGGGFLWAVLKADAYGHGIKNVVPALASADGLAFACIEEALSARSAGWRKEILALEGFFEACELESFLQNDVSAIIHSRFQLEVVKNVKPAGLKCWVKINTGMNRLGFEPEEFEEIEAELSDSGCTVCGAMTHFANAGSDAVPQSAPHASDQLARASRIKCGRVVCANSAAIMLENIRAAEARAGIVIFGVSPNAAFTEDELELKPALRLETKIISVRRIKAGEFIGYGSVWRARRDSTIAVAACGYADGIPRTSQGERYVHVDGVKLPIVGAVSMDMLAVDATDHPGVFVGSAVEIFGGLQSANEFATSSGTIAAELLCAIAPRVPRVTTSTFGSS